jgi:hypothetical protein
MLQGHRQRRLEWNDANGREQRRDRQDVEKREQDDRKRETLTAPAGRIVEYLSVSHGRALMRNPDYCQ